MAAEGDATFEIKIDGLEGGPAGGGTAGDDAELADFYARAKAAYDKRNSQKPRTARDKAPATEQSDPKRWLDDQLQDIQRRRTRAMGVLNPVASGKSILKSAIAEQAKQKGVLGAIARRAILARAAVAASAAVAYVGTQAISGAGAVGNTLASAIPGLGGMPSHSGYNVGGMARNLLATGAATVSSTFEAGSYLNSLTRLSLLDDAAARGDDVGIRIAAKNAAKARISVAIAAMDSTSFAEGALEGGGEGAMYAAQQMWEATAANPAAMMGSIVDVAKQIWSEAGPELRRLIFG